MAKQINIDWDVKNMVRGKCTGVGCPIRNKCERFTSKEFDPAYGFISPPHGITEHATTSGRFPEKCINFQTNAPYKPLIKTVEIQD